MKEEIKVEKGSGNVFEDLGYPKDKAELMALTHDLFLQYLNDHEKERLKKEYYNKGINTAIETIMQIALDKSMDNHDGIRLALIKITQVLKRNKK